jgi:lantibiotic biosynthesis protein
VSVGSEPIQAARTLAAVLAESAIRHDGMAGWSGATAPAALGEPASWRVFGGDYYEGSAGVARFLARLATLDGDDDSDDGDDASSALARAGLEHALRRTEGWSLHSGSLGVGLVAREVAALLGDHALWERGTAACEAAIDAALSEAEGGPVTSDLLAGLAGALHAAARLARAAPGPWRERSLRLGAALAALALPADGGLAWPLSPHDPQLLCGLAHGAAGVALAFTDLAAIEPDEPRWPALAAAARRFERAHFHPTEASWADRRAGTAGSAGIPAQPPHPHFWCHGSVGVAWERLAAIRAWPECPLIAADLAAGLHGARREATRVLAGPTGPGAGPAANASQCHGLSGTIDLLAATGERHDRDLAAHLAAFVRDDARRPDGWRCGLPSMEPTPGMMLGLAGIGWAQLRAARPDAVPPAWTPASPLACGATPDVRVAPVGATTTAT